MSEPTETQYLQSDFAPQGFGDDSNPKVEQQENDPSDRTMEGIDEKSEVEEDKLEQAKAEEQTMSAKECNKLKNTESRTRIAREYIEWFKQNNPGFERALRLFPDSLVQIGRYRIVRFHQRVQKEDEEVAFLARQKWNMVCRLWTRIRSPEMGAETRSLESGALVMGRGGTVPGKPVSSVFKSYAVADGPSASTPTGSQSGYGGFLDQPLHGNTSFGDSHGLKGDPNSMGGYGRSSPARGSDIVFGEGGNGQNTTISSQHRASLVDSGR